MKCVIFVVNVLNLVIRFLCVRVVVVRVMKLVIGSFVLANGAKNERHEQRFRMLDE